jgi:hypothetical protein
MRPVLRPVLHRGQQQLVDADRPEPLLVGDLVAAVELELAAAPVEERAQQPRGLDPQRIEEPGTVQVALAHQQVGQPDPLSLRTRREPLQHLVRYAPLRRQHRAEPFLGGRVEGVGGDDPPLEEGDCNDVVHPLDRQDAGLTLLGDHLEDLREAEQVEGAFDGHGSEEIRSRAQELRATRNARAPAASTRASPAATGRSQPPGS